MASKRIIKQYANNKRLMEEVKEWIYDCGYGDMKTINAHSNLHIVRCMDKEYAGGIEQFIIDCDLLEIA